MFVFEIGGIIFNIDHATENLEITELPNTPQPKQ